MTPTLAESSTWLVPAVIGNAVLTLVGGLVLGVIQLWIARQFKRADSLQAEVKRLAREQVTSEIKQVASEFGKELTSMRKDLDQVIERIDDGNTTFKEITQAAQRMELAFTRAVAELPQSLSAVFIRREECGARKDTTVAIMDEHDRRITRLEQTKKQ